MTLTINGERVEVRAQTLPDALEELGYGEDRIATAVNEAFVPAALRETVALKDGDRLEIVAPRQGG